MLRFLSALCVLTTCSAFAAERIFDFNQDIYTKPIRMELLYFVRGDIKFESLEQLKMQLSEDKIAVTNLLNTPLSGDLDGAP